MRDGKRIEPFLQEIQKIWEQVPDWRFFQLICNIQRIMGTDGFYIEDEDAIMTIKKIFQGPLCDSCAHSKVCRFEVPTGDTCEHYMKG